LCFPRRPQKLMKSSTQTWHLLHNVKSTVKISSIFVAFLGNMNFNTISTRVCPRPPLDFLTFLRPCEYLKRDAYFMCFTLQSCPEDVQCQFGYIWDHPSRRQHFLGQQGLKICQICQRIVVKRCRRSWVRVKNRENLPTS
jgi:hypothetical protein